jgi:hypothetical protein
MSNDGSQKTYDESAPAAQISNRGVLGGRPLILIKGFEGWSLLHPLDIEILRGQ